MRNEYSKLIHKKVENCLQIVDDGVIFGRYHSIIKDTEAVNRTFCL